MSGIAGLFHLETPKPVAPGRLSQMIDAQAHRGPDGHGIWTAPGVGLGHRRLSVVDVQGSAQPLASEDGLLTISHDGAIYNYQEVRAELLRLGNKFRTAGVAEVILNGYRQWGTAVLARLNGVFAFAIHDGGDQSLLLARDRLGVKPLHYTALADGSIAFASELKGLLANPAVRREPELQAVEDYLAFGYVPDDACLIAGVKKLPGGTYLKLVRGKPLPSPMTWWDLDYSKRAKGRASDLAEELRFHLRNAVAARMVSDVPIGATLSGGVASATIVALMAERSADAVQTCSIGLDEAALDETRHAQAIATRFATDHRSRIVVADDFSAIDALAGAFDEPFADPSALLAWRVCQLAREIVTVALAGDGADEAFAGHRRYQRLQPGERIRRLLPAGLRQTLFTHWPRADWALAPDAAEAYARSASLIPEEIRRGLFSEAFQRGLQGHRAEDRYVRAMREAPARDALDRAQYADMMIRLPGEILTRLDRTSMAVSLEAREPLLDHRLVEFAATLPAALRIRRGEGKWLMKKAMEVHLPQDILYRPNVEFAAPVSAWFRGPLATQAEALATRSTLLETGWFRPEALEKAVWDHKSGLADNGWLIWQLVMLEKALGRLF